MRQFTPISLRHKRSWQPSASSCTSFSLTQATIFSSSERYLVTILVSNSPPRLLRARLIDRSPRYPPSSISLPSNSRLPRRFRLFRDKNGRPGMAGMHLSNAGEESLSRYSNTLPAHVRSRISSILAVSLARRAPRHSSRRISNKRLDVKARSVGTGSKVTYPQDASYISVDTCCIPKPTHSLSLPLSSYSLRLLVRKLSGDAISTVLPRNPYLASLLAGVVLERGNEQRNWS